MANRYRWEILAESRKREAQIDILLGLILPIAIISFSILWRLFHA